HVSICNPPALSLYAAFPISFYTLSLHDALPIFSFRADVAPLLLEHCVACHNAKNAEGGYRVDTFAELIKPGDSGEPPIGDATAQDRKSTRLNSSHVKISYAVFCLKKKKIKRYNL